MELSRLDLWVQETPQNAERVLRVPPPLPTRASSSSCPCQLESLPPQPRLMRWRSRLPFALRKLSPGLSDKVPCANAHYTQGHSFTCLCFYLGNGIIFLVDVAPCNCSLAKPEEIAEEIFSPSRSGGFWTRKAERLIVAFIRERWGKQFSKITLKLSETLGYRHIEILTFNPFSSKVAMVGTWSPELSSFSAQSLQNIFPKFGMRGFK